MPMPIVLDLVAGVPGQQVNIRVEAMGHFDARRLAEEVQQVVWRHLEAGEDAVEPPEQVVDEPRPVAPVKPQNAKRFDPQKARERAAAAS